MLRWSFVAGGVGLFMSYYGQFWNMLSQAHLDFKFVSLLKIGSSLAQILPGIAIAILTHNPLLIIAWGALASTFQVLGFVWHARSKYDLGFHLREARWSRLREMWAYSAKTTACLVVNSLFGAVDRIVAGRLAGAVEFRDYNVATNAGARLQGLSTAAMGPVFYNASRAVGAEDGQKAAAMFDEAFGLVADWYFLAATWLIVWHLPVLHLWLGAEHVPGIAPMFPALIAAFALSSISNVSRAMLGPLNRVGMEVILSVILALVTVGCVWVGWNAAGIVGVAWGFLASRFTLVSLDFYVARFIGAQGWLSARLWLRIGIQIVLALVLSLITTWIDCSFALKLSLAGMHLTIVAGWLLGPSLSSQWKQRRGLPPSSINET
jgi:O-antigen/teichoic acid export membrane protein